MSDDTNPLLCPSSRCEEGARLLGIVQQDGTVAFTPDDIRIDAAFVRIAQQGRKPESRFRFGSACQRKRCAQWTGERCGVVDAVLHEITEAGITMPESVPNCAIRSNCRWFDQRGYSACRVCPLVITDLDNS
jgi:hypothetical protein